ncbi:MAG: tRNA (N(6)-L-threonylcarbamoyladenosine(37)-C(2))-methylthiotransferase MtaB [Bacteroidales bacterium]|nr:tRNA (N(6)-L-threonylcarbamoyladenosine(37)-C(2))-methylthiotransferase MtaB [Bacteroidales bacterium]
MIDNETFSRKTVAFHTLGCKLNFSETSEMARRLQERGYSRVDFDEVADIYVINTCSVTEEANKKCRQVIKRCIRRNGDAFVVVTGCYAQLEAQQVANIEGVSLVIGNNEKNDIATLIGNACHSDNARIEAGDIMKDKRFRPSFSSGDRTRSFLKIQDGCNYFCTYCTIPFARGTSRSDTVENTIAEARRAAHAGAKEVILTGVNIGDFGRNNGETFEQLVEALEDVEGIERYRISSIEPNLLTDRVLELVAKSKKFMPHFHVPLQSGSNAVLQMMHRRYTAEFFADKIASIRSLIPRAFVGIDVIVGVNGETPEYFEETKTLLEGIDFSQLHVFTYSERPGTLALKLKPVVEIPERHRRNAVLHELSEQKRIAFYKRFINTEATVLFESSEHEGRMSGFTDNYLKVDLPYDASLSNTIHRVRIDSLTMDKSAVLVSVID